MKLVLVQPSQRSSAAAFDAIGHALGAARARGELTLDPSDVMLLPEHVRERGDHETYLTDLQALARSYRCHVVGGSFHEQRADRVVNSGVVLTPDGDVLERYEKLRPYAREREHAVPGERLGSFELGCKSFLVLVCADFWFMDLVFRAPRAPDVILVPAFSVTRKPSPRYSQSLWRHLAIARAYELGVYVGISDWAHDESAPFPTCGVGGLADPTPTAPERFFTPIAPRGVSVFELDFDALDAFRHDRIDRGFFWRHLPALDDVARGRGPQ